MDNLWGMFILLGWIPVDWLMLAIQERGMASSLSICFRKIGGMLLGPAPLLMLNFLIMAHISGPSTGNTAIEFGLLGGRNLA